MRFNCIYKVIFSLILVLAVTGCSKNETVKNPLDGFKLIVDYDIFETFVSFRFIDSSTGELIGASNNTSVTLTIEGDDKDAVVDQLGEHYNEFNSFSGLLSLALNPKPPYVPETENPVSFSITAEYEGYYSEIKQIDIVETGKYTYDIYMEKSSGSSSGKEFLRYAALNNEGMLIDSISIGSHGSDFYFMLDPGATFFDSNGEKLIGEEISVLVKIYNKVSSAPIPTTLIANVEKNGDVNAKAFNPFNMADIKIKVDNKEVSYIENEKIKLYLEVDGTRKDPANWSTLQVGRNLDFCRYDSKNSRWVFEEQSEVVSQNNKKYILSEVNYTAVYSGAILQEVCNFSGTATFNSEEDAFKEQVYLSLECSRVGDGKFLGREYYKFLQSEYQGTFNFTVPEGNKMRLSIVNRDQTNSFSATPSTFQIDSPCNGENNIETQLVPTSMDFSGSIRFRFNDEFPTENIRVRINFYDNIKGSYLLSQIHTIKDGDLVDISSTLNEASSLRIVCSAVDSDNQFDSDPAEIIVSDPQELSLSWELYLTPQKCRLSGIMDFIFKGGFGGTLIDYEIEIREQQTNSILESHFLQCSENNIQIPFSTVLPKYENVYFKLKRIEGGIDFHIYPYEVQIGNPCQIGNVWSFEISPVEVQIVNVNVSITCPNAQIIPSFKGYYRLVWEDEWQEIDLEYGNATLEMELNGTYELGVINEGEMISEEYIITGPDLTLEFELDQDICSQFGY